MMTPGFALFQTTLEIPPVDLLKKAFRTVRGLTSADAHSLANDAFGILVRNLPHDTATALHRALADVGIETAIVPAPSIPALPATRYVRRAECRPDALVLQDPLGRPQPVSWDHIRVVAAGCIDMTDSERRESRRPGSETAFLPWPRTGLAPRKPSPSSTILAGDQAGRWVIELILFGLASRVTIEVDALPGLPRQAGPSVDAESVFLGLAASIAQGAPRALHNRGVLAACQEPPTLFRYPSRNAFQEELLWTLWRAQAGEDEEPPPPLPNAARTP